MMKESQKRMMQHSEVKIKLLRFYLERYLNILSKSRYIGDIYIYDLFCGEGVYENGGKGSPMIILETVKNVFLENKSKGNLTSKFHCLFNDIDEDKLLKLKNEVISQNLHHDEFGGLRYSQQDYRNILPQVVTEIDQQKKGKAFIFIDPYGYRDIKLCDIKELLDSGKSEVLLFLPTQFMFRFESKSTPECLVEFINELMPVELWPESETGLSFIETLTEAFRNAIGDSYFVDSFIISREKNQFFCLFFFTSHIYGFDRMLDSKWQIDKDEGRGWSYQSEFNLFSQIDQKPNTYKFERVLYEFLKIERTNSEVYLFTLHNGHLPSHTNDILVKLQKEGRLSVLFPDGRDVRKSAFYLNYEHYKNEPQKIRLKIK